MQDIREWVLTDWRDLFPMNGYSSRPAGRYLGEMFTTGPGSEYWQSRPSDQRTRIVKLLRTFQQGPAMSKNQRNDARGNAALPSGSRLLDRMFGPHQTARASARSPFERMLPPGMTVFEYMFDPTAEARPSVPEDSEAGHHPRMAADGARDLWSANSRGALFAPSIGGASTQTPSRGYLNQISSDLSTDLAYGTARRSHTGQGGSSRREAPIPDIPQNDMTPGQIPSPQPDAGPPTTEPVERGAMYHWLDFDPNGPGERDEALRHPLAAWTISGLADESIAVLMRLQKAGRFAPGSRHNNEADAFRHAYWSYRMTQELGPTVTKTFADAHERSAPNDDPERLMDLYNNEVGRRLAMDPKNRSRPAEEVILEALRNGWLQKYPFSVIDGSGGP